MEVPERHQPGKAQRLFSEYASQRIGPTRKRRWFSVLVIPNTTLKTERGNEFDAGVKILRPRWNVTLAYFVNNLHDFVGSAFAPPLFVPADPANGINAISPFFPFHGVLYVQRTNTARARIKGLEATYEISLPLGHTGTITPFG